MFKKIIPCIVDNFGASTVAIVLAFAFVIGIVEAIVSITGATP